jgi:hypothetical protein
VKIQAAYSGLDYTGADYEVAESFAGLAVGGVGG